MDCSLQAILEGSITTHTPGPLSETMQPPESPRRYNVLLRQYEQVKRLIKIQCKSWSAGLSKTASVSGRWNCSVPEQGFARDWHEEGVRASGKVASQCGMSGWAKKASLWEGRGWRWADEEGQRLNE